MNFFEIASREKLRFESSKGLLAAEQLWDLPLTSTVGAPNLDDIAVALYGKLQTAKPTVSFVTKPAVAKAEDFTEVKLEIVKHIIDVRVKDRDDKAAAQEKAQAKQRVLAIMAKRKDEALDNMSDEELKKMLDAM